MHPFEILMIATFFAAIAALGLGISRMGAGKPSTPFMFARVGLCLLLLVEILIYISYIR